jgi:hypothetical protein
MGEKNLAVRATVEEYKRKSGGKGKVGEMERKERKENSFFVKKNILVKNGNLSYHIRV